MSPESGDTRETRLAGAEEIVGHGFSDRSLLECALTHPSAHEGESRGSDYERLEFLGDAVLGLVVVEELYRRYPDLGEGEMTKLKISVVSGGALADSATRLGISDLIVTGRSEEGTGSRGRRSALENVFEALVGALYLDAGLGAARAFIIGTLGERLDHTDPVDSIVEHPKSSLQELTQRQGMVPVYRISSEGGPPHDRRFTAQVTISGRVLGVGEGATKKEAEMHAAAAALVRLRAGEPL